MCATQVYKDNSFKCLHNSLKLERAFITPPEDWENIHRATQAIHVKISAHFVLSCFQDRAKVNKQAHIYLSGNMKVHATKSWKKKRKKKK